MTDDDLSPFEELENNPTARQFLSDLWSGKPPGEPRRPRSSPRPYGPAPNDLARALRAYIQIVDQNAPGLDYRPATLADESGVDRGTLSRILTGETSHPQDGTLEALATALQARDLVSVTPQLLQDLRDGSAALPLAEADLPPEWRVVLDQVFLLPDDWQALLLDNIKNLVLWAAWMARQSSK